MILCLAKISSAREMARVGLCLGLKRGPGLGQELIIQFMLAVPSAVAGQPVKVFCMTHVWSAIRRHEPAAPTAACFPIVLS